MFEKIRNKYLFNKTQILVLDKQGTVLESDNFIYNILPNTPIIDFHPFFETIIALIDSDNQEFTFSCIHVEFNEIKKTIDVIFNSGSDKENPFLIFIDFTEHYDNFQSIAQEKNESVLNFHLTEIKNLQLQSEKNFKNKFLANVSHDLKTPLSASIWFVEMLEKSEISDNQKEIIDLIKETTFHIKKLVDDILDLSKIEMGQFSIKKSTFNFLEMIEHIEKINVPKANEKKLKFTVEKDNNLPKFVVGDKTRIIQIIINLLDNSIKFTKEGSVTLSVNVKNIIKNKAIISIKVSDTGSGIKITEKDEVFQSFKKLHNSKKIDGSGLGLSIVFNLLEMMKGTIDYYTKINEGTTFIIELPLSIKQDIDDIKSFEKIKILDSYSILIVDDDAISQLLLKKHLINHGGFTVDFAKNGKDALELITQNNYDLVFMDKEMPDMDGLETLNTIKNNKSNKVNSIPVICVSGHSINHQKELLEGANFEGFLSKPFQKEEIYEIIYKVLKLKKP